MFGVQSYRGKNVRSWCSCISLQLASVGNVNMAAWAASHSTNLDALVFCSLLTPCSSHLQETFSTLAVSLTQL